MADKIDRDKKEQPVPDLIVKPEKMMSLPLLAVDNKTLVGYVQLEENRFPSLLIWKEQYFVLENFKQYRQVRAIVIVDVRPELPTFRTT